MQGFACICDRLGCGYRTSPFPFVACQKLIDLLLTLDGLLLGFVYCFGSASCCFLQLREFGLLLLLQGLSTLERRSRAVFRRARINCSATVCKAANSFNSLMRSFFWSPAKRDSSPTSVGAFFYCVGRTPSSGFLQLPRSTGSSCALKSPAPSPATRYPRPTTILSKSRTKSFQLVSPTFNSMRAALSIRSRRDHQVTQQLGAFTAQSSVSFARRFQNALLFLFPQQLQQHPVSTHFHCNVYRAIISRKKTATRSNDANRTPLTPRTLQNTPGHPGHPGRGKNTQWRR